MMRMNLMKVWALLCLAAVTASGAEPKAGAEPAVSLTSYWRYLVTVRPPVTSEPFVNDKGQKFTEVPVRRCAWGGAVRSVSAFADPPVGWEATDFDDSAWPVQRAPVCTGPALLEDHFWDQPQDVRRLVGRIRFDVPDPAAVKRISLSVTYRGGAMVYLNGEEVARKHLAAGALKPDDYAEGYPKGAYMPADENEGKVAGKRTHYGLWSNAIIESWHGRNTKWKDTPEILAVAEKVYNLRNRTTGPVEIPGNRLRKGANVLAIEVRQAAIAPVAHSWTQYPNAHATTWWGHLWVEDLSLVAEPEGSVRPVSRPSGVQLWGEDIHRWVFNADFLEPGVKARPVEIVAARGGQFSGQAVIGSSAALGNLTATVSDLTGGGGAVIPSAAVLVRYGIPTPLPAIENYTKGSMRTDFHVRAMYRHAKSMGIANWSLEAFGKLAFFDRLSATPPAGVPAGSSQTIWLTVSVPKDAAPGEYRGKLTVRAAGMPEGALDVKVAVTGFTLPPPPEWTTFAGIEESPYSVAKGYNLAPWSEEHWKRVEQCVEWLGGLGNNLVQVPLICNTEMGNAESMVPWVKKGDGYEYDWTLLDRFLGLARRNYRKPLALTAHVHQIETVKNPKVAVTLVDGATRATLDLGAPGTPEFNKLWMPFAKAFVAHVREKQLADSIHWGIFYDFAPPTLLTMASDLARELPEVGWSRSSHDGEGRKPFTKENGARVTLDAHIRGFDEPDWARGGVGRKGWSRTDLNVLYPRCGGTLIALNGLPPRWHLRELPEVAIMSSARGFGRVAANYWERDAGGWYTPSILHILYPGKDRVDGSVQYEMLREGLQECEARIAIEKKNAEATILKERARAAMFLPGGLGNSRSGEFYGGWQERSRALYEAAAR